MLESTEIKISRARSAENDPSVSSQRTRASEDDSK